MKNMLKDEVERALQFHSSSSKLQQQDSGMYGRFGCDTSLSLLNATVEEMKKVWENPDWIFISGDLAAHGLSDRASPMLTTTNKLKEEFPNVPLYFCFGNNDVALEDYQMDCSSDWFGFAYSLWGEYIPNDQEETFLQMGAYRVNISHSDPPFPAFTEKGKAPLRLLVLNTVLYAVESNHHDENDPCGQFEWMKNELQEARNDSAKVYLMAHIMPGIDSYEFTPAWNPNQSASFFDILTEYSDVIIGQFYGHVHHDEFRVFGEPNPDEQYQHHQQQQEEETKEREVRGEQQEPFQGLVNPAISPIFGNNPAFRLSAYNPKTFAILDYQIHYMDLVASNEQETPIWNALYSFDEYRVGEAAQEGLSLLYKRLFENEDEFDTWYSYRTALGDLQDGIPEPGTPGWACLLCALSATDEDSFVSCIMDEGVTEVQCSKVH
eukprot:CAMPEP_0201486672 /NCGR_PEP_ID=MMETSP0151_2-20130828/10735_1 /ASSEMBLY_ACC=CAM_ASM_000257 /TAXON_ID=200890 /ORGANISM="Paramoeba atlantica, Strain 621/1 / CCAP 1560/9" /LENGTH=435 /DNA_ID=CAMNT_0047871447 /DNA_START=137 /DNA_END=1444 /DNA_ORIENTATION=+